MTQKNKSLVPVIVTVATVGAAAGAALLARRKQGEIKEFVVANVLEKPAGRSSFTDLGQGLERGGTFLAGRGVMIAYRSLSIAVKLPTFYIYQRLCSSTVLTYQKILLSMWFMRTKQY